MTENLSPLLPDRQSFELLEFFLSDCNNDFNTICVFVNSMETKIINLCLCSKYILVVRFFHFFLRYRKYSNVQFRIIYIFILYMVLCMICLYFPPLIFHHFLAQSCQLCMGFINFFRACKKT